MHQAAGNECDLMPAYRAKGRTEGGFAVRLPHYKHLLQMGQFFQMAGAGELIGAAVVEDLGLGVVVSFPGYSLEVAS